LRLNAVPATRYKVKKALYSIQRAACRRMKSKVGLRRPPFSQGKETP
jgi:hypothetical protein